MQDFMVAEDVELSDILDIAVSQGMTAEQTLEFLYGALGLAQASTKRVFTYSAPVSATQPAGCQASFTRSFVHTDWIDGESIVQAEQTTIEEGFNSRFHNIENDLDALATDIAQAFVCLGDQRAAISKALDEVRAELNRINADIYGCCEKSKSGGFVIPGYTYPYPPGATTIPDLGWVIPRPSDIFPPIGPRSPVDNPWKDVWSGPVINPTDTWVAAPWGEDRVDPVRSYVEKVRGAQSYAGAAAHVARSNADPTRGVVAGLSARLIEETSFNGQSVEVWSTAAGLILVPKGEEAAAKQGRKSWTNPRVEVTDRFARWAARNEKQVADTLGERFTTKKFVEAFGDARVAGGIRISDVLDRLPSDIEAGSPLDLVTHLAESNGKAVVREGLASETVIGAVGLIGDAGKGLGDARLTALKTVDERTASALMEAGISTIGDLAKAAPKALSRLAARAGIEIPVDAAAGLVAQAATLVAVDRAARGVRG